MSDEDVQRARRVLARHGIDAGDEDGERSIRLSQDHVWVSYSNSVAGRRREVAVPIRSMDLKQLADLMALVEYGPEIMAR